VKYLLDTHIWIWSVSKPEKLSEEVKNILGDDSNEFFISSISFWEFIVLVDKGKITISKSVDEWIRDAIIDPNIKEIPIDKEIAIKSRKINLPHQDPADRFIAATAFIHQMTLITSDRKLEESEEISVLFNRI
jgi:PIN domain nuclease of toxin-antitoxin system